jgi:transposase
VAAPAGISGPGAGPLAAVTLGYVRAIAAVREQATLLEARIGEQLASHPDGHIFTSLPRSGTVRAAALLAEIGDYRARFPTVDSLACLAGAAPSTRQSGQHRVVTFRFACDKKLRDALIDFAADSRLGNAWAAEVYRRAPGEGQAPPTRGAHPGPGLAGRDLALLAGPQRLRPARHQALQRQLLEPAA